MSASRSSDLAYLLGGVVLGGVAVIGAAYLASQALQPDPSVDAAAADRVAVMSVPDETATAADPTPDDEAPATQATDETGDVATAATTDGAPQTETAAVGPPRLEEVRVEADGLAVIAGQASPFADIILRADGEEVARASADASGAFATVASFGASGAARVLTLAELDADGAEIASPDELILAPITVAEAAPVAVAEADEVANGDASVPLAANDNAGGTEASTTVAPEDTGVAVAETSEDPDRQTRQSVDAAASEPETAADPTSDTVAVAEAADAQSVPVAPEGAQTEATAPEGALAETTAPEGALAETTVSEGAQADTAATDGAQTATVASARVPEATADTPAPTASAAEEAGAAPDPDAAVAEAQTPERTTQTVAVLRSDEEGVSLVRPTEAAPEVMDELVLDTIGYSEAGDVQLSGSVGRAATGVQVYLNNRPVAALPVAADGAWRGTVPDIASGVYTLRLDAVDANGRVTSRIETPFKRETPQVLAAALDDTTDQKVRRITVQQGNTLWAIARDRYGEGLLYVRVFEANRDAIRDPDLIYPGQIFTLPDE